MIVVLGDCNARIGNRVSFRGKEVLERTNDDEKENKQGRDMLEVWGAVGLVPLTGLHWKEGRKKKTLTARCTFKNRNGQSNIDHVGVRGADL